MMKVVSVSLSLVVAAVLSGCGHGSDRWLDARPVTAPVSGVVKFQGEPLEGAIVVFQPVMPNGFGASALTDEEGKFELKTFPPSLGAVPGKYSVLIVKTEMPAPAVEAENEDDPLPTFAVSLIPEKYGNPAQTDLSAEIPDEGTNALEFDLVQ